MLELNLHMVPQANENQGEKGWVFGALARILEDRGVLEYRKVNGFAFYRSRL
jgi:hypothetical protein